MDTIIQVENGDALTALRTFFRRLFEEKIIEALYVPLQIDGSAILPALVTDLDHLANADPLTPVMPINGARAVSALTGKGVSARLGAVLRSCEIRALIELVKLQQATLDGVTLIGIDCLGTFEPSDFYEKKQEGVIELDSFLDSAKDGIQTQFQGFSLRPSCQICTQPEPQGADIHVHLLGVDIARGIPVKVNDEIGSALDMPIIPGDESKSREVVVNRLVEFRTQARERELVAMQSRMTSDGGLASLFATCIRCHNCMTVCPICYCKTCLFKTNAFDHPPEHYLNAAQKKGAIRMLGDNLLFHLTRMNHMSTSCVSCGMCTSACPSEIPVGTIFSTVGAQTQSAFRYYPGRDVTEPLPLITFQVDEWADIGEAK
jgi:formate dehydrogenase subunit beta